MASSDRHIPQEGQPLCETCGYILEGLPPESNCPECGHPVMESINPQTRRLPLWETAPGPASFIATSVYVLVRPSRFYRALETRRNSGWSTVFSLFWLGVCSLVLSATALGHALWLETRGGFMWPVVPQWTITIYAVLKVFVVPAVFLMLILLTRIAARLTAWEAAYRGLRLPLKAVQRAMDYHSVHLLPVCVLALATVYVYRMMLVGGAVSRSADLAYLWILCGEVVLGAGYLFFTYWAAMRNIMFANK